MASVTEFRCVLTEPAYYKHQIFAQDFVKKEKKRSSIEHAIPFHALLTKFPGAKKKPYFTTIELKKSELSEGYKLKQAKFRVVLTDIKGFLS